MPETQEQGGNRSISKYAAKKAAIARGERPPFEFKDKKSRQGRVERSNEIAYRGNLRGIVKQVFTYQWHSFVTLRDGSRLYLSDRTLAEFMPGIDIIPGDRIDCDVEPQEGKSPRITRIYAIIPPD